MLVLRSVLRSVWKVTRTPIRLRGVYLLRLPVGVSCFQALRLSTPSLQRRSYGAEKHKYCPDFLNHTQTSFRMITVNNTVFCVVPKVFKGTVSRGCGFVFEPAAGTPKNQHLCTHTDRGKRIKTLVACRDHYVGGRHYQSSGGISPKGIRSINILLR